jgi:hypothetical protein
MVRHRIQNRTERFRRCDKHVTEHQSRPLDVEPTGEHSVVKLGKD